MKFLNSPSRARTYDNAVNSRALYRLSYRGLLRLYLKNYTQLNIINSGKLLDKLSTY